MSDTATPPPEPQKPLTLDPGKKYIRTFAGDMEVAKQGGTPELAPYVSTAPEQAVPAPAAPTVPAPPVPAPAPASPTYDDAKRAETLARLRAAKAADAAQPLAARSMTRADTSVEDLGTASPLHTYAEDFTDHVATEGASSLTVLAAEQDAQSGHMAEQAPSPSRKNYFIMAGALVLLVVGGGVGYYTYTEYQRAHQPVPAAPRIYAPIFTDEQVAIEGEGPALLSAVAAQLAVPLVPGTVRLLYSENATTTRESVFIASGLPVPSVVARNVRGAESVIGLVSIEEGSSPFFILSVNSYNDTFAGMLAWERTVLNDLGTLYPPHRSLEWPAAPSAPLASSSTTTASTSDRAATTTTTAGAGQTGGTPVLRIPGFYDEVIANHDARVYHDMQGETVLVYGYWSPTVLVIARNAQAYQIILDRLANSRVTQ